MKTLMFLVSMISCSVACVSPAAEQDESTEQDESSVASNALSLGPAVTRCYFTADGCGHTYAGNTYGIALSACKATGCKTCEYGDQTCPGGGTP